MKFWDASAIVPLVLSESREDAAIGFDGKPPICVWWATVLEAVSAIARREREGALTAGQVENCVSRLAQLSDDWMEVAPSNALRDSARRLLRVHALRAADSLQLAAALALADDEPGRLDFVCRDARLAEAAAREGLRVRTT